MFVLKEGERLLQGASTQKGYLVELLYSKAHVPLNEEDDNVTIRKESTFNAFSDFTPQLVSSLYINSISKNNSNRWENL